MAASPTDLHFVLFPMMAQGHLVPMADFAQILAQRGATISIITTPNDANRIRPVISRAIEAKLKIQLLELQLPLAEAGLPEGCENMDKLPSFAYCKNLMAAIALLEQPAEDLLRKLSPPPDCIISDFLFPWTTDLARRFNIPRIVFNGPGCFYLLCMHVVIGSKLLESVESVTERVVLPGLPDRVEVTKLQIMGSSRAATEDDIAWWVRASEAEKASFGIMVHTFEELEPEYVKEYKRVKNKNIWCIGPVSLCNTKSQRGNVAAIDERQCVKWLDSHEPGSVVYACFGSLVRLNTPQLIELGLGLEASNRPFIWVVKSVHREKEVEEWLAESGFEERVKDRGLIIRGWAPQVLILSHPSVGGFLTHCGWNSTLESVCSGVPMITWPQFAEQFINEKLVVQVLGIGFGVGADSVVHVGEEDRFGVKVKSESVTKAIERVMGDGVEGAETRERAKELGIIARNAIKEGGSSHLNLTLLIQDIMHLANASC
ncbi:hypothetical protein SSX86_001008 [Deinandra increscens subsp. villosa]|uniref:Glycosyltransferase n=1 Tax=Deinandra increscens subsp. villosa TaxID=3103831 RepID=A0AAP0DVA6_9ASTR